MEAIIAALIGFAAVLLATVLSWIRSDIESDISGVESDVTGLKSDVTEVRTEIAANAVASDKEFGKVHEEFGKVHETLARIVGLLRGQGERIARLEGREEARKESLTDVPV